jgi:hypothetical protein
MAPSRRLRRRQVEDGWVDAMDGVGPCYPTFTVFNVLVSRGIVVFYPFAWAYMSDHRGMGLLATSQFDFHIHRVEVCHE